MRHLFKKKDGERARERLNRIRSIKLIEKRLTKSLLLLSLILRNLSLQNVCEYYVLDVLGHPVYVDV